MRAVLWSGSVGGGASGWGSIRVETQVRRAAPWLTMRAASWPASTIVRTAASKRARNSSPVSLPGIRRVRSPSSHAATAPM